MNIIKIKQFVSIVSFILITGFGYSVFANINEAQQKKFLLDTDQDNLSDAEEISYGTNPNKADTDNDGYSDGVEIQSGYNPLKPAPGDKTITPSTSNNTPSSNNLTNKFAFELKSFFDEKKQEEDTASISISDIDTFLKESMSETTEPISIESLPDFIIPEEKIIKQPYGNLNESVRKEKIKEDTLKYITEITYLFANNLPSEVRSVEELQNFGNLLISHLNDLNRFPADYSFYSAIRPNIENFTLEASLVSVPENLVTLHTYGIRILKAYIALGDSAPSNTEDPMAHLLFVKKISPMVDITVEYLSASFKRISQDINPE